MLLSLVLATLAFASPDVPHSTCCQDIFDVYSACRSSSIRYNGKEFDFLNGRNWVSVACSDGKDLGFYDRLDKMDVSSIFLLPYVTGQVPLPEVRRNWDPGRLRVEPLLKSIFGVDEEAARANLVPVNFLGQKVKFQRQLGAAAALEAVGKDLEAEIARDASLAKFLEPFTSGAVNLREYIFSWRFVKGTTRLSTHSFGTGIDLLLDEGPQYWLWDEMKNNPERAKLGEQAYRDVHYVPTQVPIMHAKVIAAFERQGFIWGGKWNHYDTMHFEYRPEMLGLKDVDCRSFSGPIRANADDQVFSLFHRPEITRLRDDH